MWSNTHNVSMVIGELKIGVHVPTAIDWGDCMFPSGVVSRYFVRHFSTLANTIESHILWVDQLAHTHMDICTNFDRPSSSLCSSMSLASLFSQAGKSGHAPHQKHGFVPNPPGNWAKVRFIFIGQ